MVVADGDAVVGDSVLTWQQLADLDGRVLRLHPVEERIMPEVGVDLALLEGEQAASAVRHRMHLGLRHVLGEDPDRRRPPRDADRLAVEVGDGVDRRVLADEELLVRGVVLAAEGDLLPPPARHRVGRDGHVHVPVLDDVELLVGHDRHEVDRGGVDRRRRCGRRSPLPGRPRSPRSRRWPGCARRSRACSRRPRLAAGRARGSRRACRSSLTGPGWRLFVARSPSAHVRWLGDVVVVADDSVVSGTGSGRASRMPATSDGGSVLHATPPATSTAQVSRRPRCITGTPATSAANRRRRRSRRPPRRGR